MAARLPAQPFLVTFRFMDRNAYVSALAELSYLREKPDASEAECQAWFEQHQSLVFPCLNYRHVVPHPLLGTTGCTEKYIPDFIAQRHDSLWDIVEIKRPCTRLMKKATRREGFYAELNTYISQCFEYCEFFDDSENRRRFEQRHGFCPQKGVTAILVAGRSIKLDRQKVFGLLSRFSKQIRHLTYDDIASYIEFERSRLFAPSENIPGVSIHIVLVLRRYAGNHNYIFDIGTSYDRNRISLYIDDKDRLTLRVTDNTGEQGLCRMEAEALKYDQVGLLSVELGFARRYTVLTMEVGGVYYADRKLDGLSVRLDYMNYVMGSDCMGQEGSMMEVAECALYANTLRFMDKERLKSYFFGKLHACMSGKSLEVMVFERNKFMHTRAHTNFVSLEDNHGRPRDFL